MREEFLNVLKSKWMSQQEKEEKINNILLEINKEATLALMAVSGEITYCCRCQKFHDTSKFCTDTTVRAGVFTVYGRDEYPSRANGVITETYLICPNEHRMRIKAVYAHNNGEIERTETGDEYYCV